MDDATAAAAAAAAQGPVLDTLRIIFRIFLVGALLDLALRRRIRVQVYRHAPLWLYSVFRASLPMVLLLLLFVLPGYIFFQELELLVDPALLRAVVLVAGILVLGGGLVSSVAIVLRGGILSPSQLLRDMAKHPWRLLGALVRLTVFTLILIAIYVLAFHTDRGLGITYVVFRHALVVVVFLVPVIWLTYEIMPRQRLARHLFVAETKWAREAFERFRYCLVINGRNAPGTFSDLMAMTQASAIRGVFRPGNRQLEIPEMTDMFDRIEAYMDYSNEYDPWNDAPEKTAEDHEEEEDESMGNWVVRSMTRLSSFAVRPEVFLLDSADLGRRRAARTTGHGDQFLRNLDAVYLLVAECTEERDVAQFRRLLDIKNTLPGVVLIQDQARANELAEALRNLGGSETIACPGADRSGIIQAICDAETARVADLMNHGSTLGDLVERELVASEFQAVDEAHERGEISDADLETITSQVMEAHGEALTERLAASAGGTAAPSERLPNALAYCGFEPVKPLIRGLVRENDYATRLYILFNVLELVAKSLVFARLAWLPDDHPLVQGFPGSVSGQAGHRGDIVDYADDTHFLYRFAMNEEGEATSVAAAAIRDRLLQPHGLDLSRDIKRLGLFFPFLRDEGVQTVAELLPFTSFLRNQIRGHGVVTNFVAAVAYPAVLQQAAAVCAVANDLDLHLHRLDEQDLAFAVGDQRASARHHVRYSDRLQDHVFLEGQRRGRPLYIAYAAGTKYRPTVLTDDVSAGP